MKKNSHARKGFTLLEIMPVVSLAAVLVLVAMFALRPIVNFQRARNQVRLGDLGLMGDAIAEHARDEGNMILNHVPSSPSSIEICSDAKTGSCPNLLSLTPLLGEYLHTIPQDPNAADDNDDPAEHSGYFIEMTGAERFRLFAPGTEPEGSDPIEITR